jgi:HTH-type transcriptional regulator / antitoxin HipB
MDDLEKYIDGRKKRDKKFTDGFEEGYLNFKVGILLRQAREEAGIYTNDLGLR